MLRDGALSIPLCLAAALSVAPPHNAYAVTCHLPHKAWPKHGQSIVIQTRAVYRGREVDRDTLLFRCLLLWRKNVLERAGLAMEPFPDAGEWLSNRASLSLDRVLRWRGLGVLDDCAA